MTSRAPGRRSFLFLQGPASPFFARLGRALLHSGHEVARINFCGGDRLFWPSGKAGETIDFGGSITEWPGYLRAEMLRRAVTDVVLFGDCRPLHVEAAVVARELGAPVWVFEEGYLRPDWITLEVGGTNARSSLPRDPKKILVAAEVLRTPPVARPVSKHGARLMALRQIAYEAASLVQTRRFPQYRTHRPYPMKAEAWGWLQRLTSLRARRTASRDVVDRVRSGLIEQYFLFPLQLDADYQLRTHSPYGSTLEVMREVLASFACHAPRHTKLLVKLHPLHNCIPDMWHEVAAAAEAQGIRDRVIIVDGGHLPTLLVKSAGVVTVNSTVGLSALGHKRPVKVLGQAVYDVPGLTFEGTLDDFWQGAPAPAPALLSAFRRLLVHQTQVNGHFHTEAGMQLAVEGALARLVATPSVLSECETRSLAAMLPRQAYTNRKIPNSGLSSATRWAYGILFLLAAISAVGAGRWSAALAVGGDDITTVKPSDGHAAH